MPGPWRLAGTVGEYATGQKVSISTEMPGPWRLKTDIGAFSGLIVSISTEMPGPWRHCDCGPEKGLDHYSCT